MAQSLKYNLIIRMKSKFSKDCLIVRYLLHVYMGPNIAFLNCFLALHLQFAYFIPM